MNLLPQTTDINRKVVATALAIGLGVTICMVVFFLGESKSIRVSPAIPPPIQIFLDGGIKVSKKVKPEELGPIFYQGIKADMEKSGKNFSIINTGTYTAYVFPNGDILFASPDLSKIPASAAKFWGKISRYVEDIKFRQQLQSASWVQPNVQPKTKEKKRKK